MDEQSKRRFRYFMELSLKANLRDYGQLQSYQDAMSQFLDLYPEKFIKVPFTIDIKRQRGEFRDKEVWLTLYAPPVNNEGSGMVQASRISAERNRLETQEAFERNLTDWLVWLESADFDYVLSEILKAIDKNDTQVVYIAEFNKKMPLSEVDIPELDASSANWVAAPEVARELKCKRKTLDGYRKPSQRQAENICKKGMRFRKARDSGRIYYLRTDMVGALKNSQKNRVKPK